MKRWFLLIVISVFTLTLQSQDKTFTPGGFIRGGIFLSTGNYIHDVNAAFSDAALTLSISDNTSIKGFADIRVRTGQQFGENVGDLYLKEAWGLYYNKVFSISAGKKIVKWGKTDFFTPLSKFNPVDYSFRSPDREDADLGNLLAEVTFTPSGFLKLTIISAPLWNPSILMTSPMTLPPNIEISLPSGLQSGNGAASFGARADISLRGTDMGFQWFHGPNLTPGLSLTGSDLSDPMNPVLVMTGVPYIINGGGLDFETVLSTVVARGTISYSKPVKEKEGNEEIPFAELEWVGGLDWTPGSFRITAEYSGKKVLDYYKAPYDPLIGREPNLAELAQLFMTPGFDPSEYFRLQTEAFNRLYNNQLEEYYHSAGLRIEAETIYGKVIPSVSCIYNFTSRDFVLIPSVKYKPADSVTLSAGIEHYSGIIGGLYDIIDDFMDCAFFTLRIDF